MKWETINLNTTTWANHYEQATIQSSLFLIEHFEDHCMCVCMYVCMYPVQVSRFQSFSTYEVATLSRVQWDRCSKSIPPTPSLSPFTNISDIQVLVTYFFSTTPIKLKLGLQVRGTILKLKQGLVVGEQPTWTNQTIYPIKNREQSINTISLCLLY